MKRDNFFFYISILLIKRQAPVVEEWRSTRLTAVEFFSVFYIFNE